MTDTATTSTSIDVATDPSTAFTVFTEEYDSWWGNGPIDAFESWRLVERTIEPGVGGRIVERHDGGERVLGTITSWEPGSRLAWTTHDEVQIEVTFRPVVDGTQVLLEATLPEVGGEAGLAMLRMAPQWFPRHLERRASGDARPDPGQLGMVLRSETPAATARWIADTFQLECTGDIPQAESDPAFTWIEFRVGNGVLVLWGGERGAGADMPIVFVDDLDAHFAHTQTAGATTSPIVEHGFRGYTAEDCEGREWQFMQAGPRIGR